MNHVLSNAYKIPCIGYGTYKVNGEEAVSVIKAAIDAGYRHIDTATFSGNEVEVGKAIHECGVAREELFITSKVWKTERGYESTKKSFLKTLEDMQLEYLDLYLNIFLLVLFLMLNSYSKQDSVLYKHHFF